MKRTKKLYRDLYRNMLIISGALILLAVMIASTAPQIGSAAPTDLGNAAVKYPIINGSAIQTCDLCHTASIPNLNPYGTAYKNNGRNTAAFGAIENLDSDGDGFTNITEINALTFPGNASSKPAAPAPTNTPVPTNTPAPVPTNTSAPNPTNTPIVVAPTATTVPSNTASSVVGLNPANVAAGGTSAASVSLNNIPAGGFASVEFTCTYNAALVEVSNITVTGLFGADPATVINGPQNGSFIVAIAGSKGSKAQTGGAAFTFTAKGLQVGQSSIACQTRASTGNLTLVAVPSTPATLVTASTQGTFSGKVVAGKPVTVTLYDAGNASTGSVNVNPDGTFSLLSSAGTFKAVASAPGYLKAQGSINITSGNTTTLSMLNLLAGDIDGNDVIDQFDALTIGINYNGTAPVAADLNNDGTINVLDLEVLAVNYRQTGPQVWQ
jgi:hypothetical protein